MKFIAVKININTFNTRILGFTNKYKDGENIVKSDEDYMKRQYTYVVIDKDNKISQSYINRALINICKNVEFALYMAERYKFTRPEKYLEIRKQMQGYYKNVDLLIENSNVEA